MDSISLAAAATSKSGRGVNWVSLVRNVAFARPDATAYIFSSDGEREEDRLTFRGVDERARRIAGKLQDLGATGERALLLFAPGLDFIAAFLGCLYAGAIAVPAAGEQIMRRHRRFDGLTSIVRDCQATWVLTTGSLLPGYEEAARRDPAWAKVRCVDIAKIDAAYAEQWQEPEIAADSLAFLQYTSGSTGAPRGVMITHGNLLAVEEMIKRAFAHSDESVVAGWLPFFHDMGLIGNILQPLYCGIQCILMPPIAFLKDPVRWLALISKYRVSTSGGPNFAYDLCVRRTPSEAREQLDLSSWRVAFNGSEPVRAQTIASFTEAFRPCGFRRQAFYPCYGLAEATLIVSGGEAESPPVVKNFSRDSLEEGSAVRMSASDSDSIVLVGCGRPLCDGGVVIVDKNTGAAVPAGKVGEIWTAGPSISPGYWNREIESERAFRASLSNRAVSDSYLRTGDLGFIWEDSLFVVGRLKDLIIIRGRNHWPPDIEATIENCHPGLRKGCGAAFSVDYGNEEGLVVVYEVEREFLRRDPGAILDCMREAIADRHELRAKAILLLKPGSVPKTSSGKVQRRECRRRFLDKAFDSDAVAISSGADCATDEPPPSAVAHDDALLQLLISEVSAVLKTPPSAIDPAKSLRAHGMDSVMAIELAAQIETRFQKAAPMAEVIGAANLIDLAKSIASGPPSQGRIAESLLAKKSDGFPRPDAFKLLPLTQQQTYLWSFHEGARERSRAFNILVVVRIRGKIGFEALKKSFYSLIRRHPSLRTRFTLQEARPVRVIEGQVSVHFPQIDLSAVAGPAAEELARSHAKNEGRVVFDMDKGPLIRPTFYRLGESEGILTLVAHHIACDGWSMRILLEEVTALYEGFLAGSPESDRNRIWDVWESEEFDSQLETSARDRQVAFWRATLPEGSLPGTTLPYDRIPPRTRNYESGRCVIRLPENLTGLIRLFAQKEEVTPFMVLLAAFETLVVRRSKIEDVVIATSSANRSQRDRQRVGPFTNALALRTYAGGNPSFRGLLARVRQTALDAYAHQDVPFEYLLQQLAPKLEGSPPLRVAFLFQNFLPTVWTSRSAAFELEDVDTGLSAFDLSLVLYEKGRSITGSFHYLTDLFEARTIDLLANAFSEILLQAVVSPETRIFDLKLANEFASETVEPPREREHEPYTIAVAGTFTGELVETTLSFWMRQLEISANIAFAPYNQVFQQLLAPASLLSQNSRGMNVLLVRISDWLPVTFNRSYAEVVREDIKEKIESFVAALKPCVAKASVPWIVCICPSGPDGVEGEVCPEAESILRQAIEPIRGVNVICWDEILDLYPVGRVHDRHTEELGGIPYTSDFFVALGTMISRRICAILSPPLKAIAVDCDDTLWEGLCAEDGPLGVRVTRPHRELQQFLLAQQEAGMLICLCSKNNEVDALAVFDRHPDLLLRRGRLARWKINWAPKSENIRALARELDLSPDSFVFIDDQPFEREEVQTHCPETLCLQLPENSNEYSHFLRHVWRFDRIKTSDEDGRRTSLYNDQSKREQYRAETPTLQAFLAGLDLQVAIEPIRLIHLDRVLQLIQRTNQFNTVSIRYSETEVLRLIESPEHVCLIANARDRFGDYGFVGVSIAEVRSDCLDIKLMLLSCRALGRGVENKMMAHLGRLASARSLSALRIDCIPTARNAPAVQFLESVCAGQKETVGTSWRYSLTADAAIRAETTAILEKPKVEEATANHRPVPSVLKLSQKNLLQIANRLSTVTDIQTAISNSIKATRTPSRSPYVPPRSPTEEELAGMCAEILRVDRVGVEDDFFALGGHSLLGTVLISAIRRNFRIDLTLNDLFARPTVAQLASLVEDALIAQMDPREMEEVTGMSESEASLQLQRESRGPMQESQPRDRLPFHR